MVTKKSILIKHFFIKNLCEKNNKIFIINDRVEEALEVMPHGIHVGRKDTSVQKCRDLFPKNLLLVILMLLLKKEKFLKNCQQITSQLEVYLKQILKKIQYHRH